MTTVDITSKLYKENVDGEPKRWTLEFLFKSGDLEYKFRSMGPFLSSKAEWLRLAEGKSLIELYNSETGYGGIAITTDDKLKFTGRPLGEGGYSCDFSDEGGDVDTVITIPRLLVADKLKAVIEEADALGYEFLDTTGLLGYQDPK